MAILVSGWRLTSAQLGSGEPILAIQGPVLLAPPRNGHGQRVVVLRVQAVTQKGHFQAHSLCLQVWVIHWPSLSNGRMGDLR